MASCGGGQLSLFVDPRHGAESRHMHWCPTTFRHTVHVSSKVQGSWVEGREIGKTGKEADGERSAAQQNKMPVTKTERRPTYLPINNSGGQRALLVFS